MSSDYSNHLIDLLTPWGKVVARRMFGGYGIYNHNLMFGLVADSTFYLKVDDSNLANYQAADSEPFTYEAKGKSRSMSYWQVPAEILEDQEKLCEWAQKAYAVAMSSKRIKSSLKEMENDKGIPAKEVFKKLRKKVIKE